MKQIILKTDHNYIDLEKYYEQTRIRSLLLVSGKTMKERAAAYQITEIAERRGIKIVSFHDFQPNPRYESVAAGVNVFRSNHCDSIAAFGGGSAMDVAKCIKLFSSMAGDGSGGSFLKQTAVPGRIRFLAVPTTAGSGAECTRFAVVYYKGEKRSVYHNSIVPDAVLLDPCLLAELPIYQKKSAMLDALCHGIESYWSVNSTNVSKKYAKEAMRLILQNMEGYLANDHTRDGSMLMASHIAGKAINITQTTAAHAMCYKLTSLYGIAHGHAAALCLKELWPWMLENTDKCKDIRGKEYLDRMFAELGAVMGCSCAALAAERFREIIKELNLEIPGADEQDYKMLKMTVNTARMKNNPIELNEDTLDELYHRILRDRYES